MSTSLLQGRTKQILMVEDNEDTAEYFRLVLADHDVTMAGTLAHAYAQVKDRLFDLYVIDQYLPDGFGIELCCKIRKIDSNTPIVFCSADAVPATRKAVLAAGAQEFLTKPIVEHQLLGSVKRQLTLAVMHSIAASVDETAAVRDELSAQGRMASATLAIAKQRIATARELIDRARVTSLEAQARQAFLLGGGCPSHFEDLWPEVLERTS